MCWAHEAVPGYEGVIQTPHGGQVIPDVLIDRDGGWLDDRGSDDRRSAAVQALKDKLDAHARAVRECARTGNSAPLISEAVAMATLWLKFRGEIE